MAELNLEHVANDIAKCLGYAKPNNAVNAHCKHATLIQGIIDNIGREQSMNVIPQGDIYRLAAKSELPGAEEFESWIFDDVLPSIHKHGAYMTPTDTPPKKIRIKIKRKLTGGKFPSLDTHGKSGQFFV